MTIYFKQQGKPALTVEFSTAEHGKNKFLYFYHKGQIIACLGSSDGNDLPTQLETAAGQLITASVADVEIIRAFSDAEQERWRRRVDPTTLTPSQVIAYFEQSPVLASMAADVRASLGPLEADGVISGNDTLAADVAQCRPHLDQLFKDDGKTTWGAQSRVAELLNITNAGSNRPRILAVLNALRPNSTTSTTLQRPVEMAVAA
jgi:hypothetical protein